jgi:hypothetical protein
MDHVTLPLVPAGTSINRALDIMSQFRRSGLVTVIAGIKTVLEAEDLLKLGMTPEIEIGQVAPLRATGTLPEKPMADYRSTEAALQHQQAHFGIFAAEGEVAVVVTLHEGIAAAMRSTRGYYRCTGPRKHAYASMPPNRLCDDDGTPVVPVDTL